MSKQLSAEGTSGRPCPRSPMERLGLRIKPKSERMLRRGCRRRSGRTVVVRVARQPVVRVVHEVPSQLERQPRSPSAKNH